MGLGLTAIGVLTILDPRRWWIDFGVPKSFQMSPRARRISGVVQVGLGLAGVVIAVQILVAV